MASSDDLWGGQLMSVTFDPATHACHLRVARLQDGVNTAYDIACHGVVDLRFRNAIREPWTYAEVTEAHFGTDDRTGLQTLELVLWSEDAELVVTGSVIDIRQVGRVSDSRIGDQRARYGHRH